MKNFLAKISYDGTGFSGWQTQKEGRTVQQVLENALSQIAKEEIKTTSAGRTDAGVHAVGQYANFHFPIQMTAKQIQLALRANLPNDVLITQVVEVIDDFNARYDAKSRTYRYILTKKLTPFNRRYKSFIPKVKIKTKIVDRCLKNFIGRHDFTSFTKFNPDLNNYYCNILNFEFEETDEDYRFVIQSNRFLHNMVRRIVGTIINISNTDTDANIIEELIAAKTPKNRLITTAPPNGLYLIEVEYPENNLIK
ncbi:MAG: tRNA pseudouridine(38-40) synthase TruA [Candidatus Cloacimonetes bacterium]|nr:tRNA pseudouridine(38-40) synthase TruA [Candidatus Cloacimonadota bacterium]